MAAPALGQQQDPWEAQWPALEAGVRRVQEDAARDAREALQVGRSYVLWVVETVGAYWAEPGWSERAAELAMPTLRAVRDLVGRVDGLELADLVERELALAVGLKQAGLFDQAARVLEELAVPGSEGRVDLRASVLVEIAEVERRRMRWPAASSWLAAAEAVADDPALASEEAQRIRLSIALQRASLELERGLPDRALAWSARARVLADGTGLPGDAARALFVEMRVHQDLSRFQRVLDAWEDLQASPTFDALVADGEGADYRRGLVSLLCNRAVQAALDLGTLGGEMDPRVPGWVEGVLAEPATSPDERVFAHVLLALWHLDRAEYAPAREVLVAGRGLLPAEEAGAPDNRRLGLAALELRVAVEGGAPPAELARVEREVRRVYERLLERWGETTAGRAGVGFLHHADKQRLLSALTRSRLRLDGSEAGARAALELVARAQAAGSLSRALGAAAPDLAHVQARLCSPERGLLLYLPARVRTHVFAVDARSVTHVELPHGVLALDRARSRLLSALLAARASPGPAARSELAAAAAELSGRLLPPLLRERIAGWRALVVVGDETLGYLPFEVLGDSDGRRLGVARAVSYLPSLPVGMWLDEHRPRPVPVAASSLRGVLAACTAPDEVPRGLGPPPAALAFGSPQLRRLGRALGGLELRDLVGPKATLAGLAALDPGHTDLLHVLAHGVTDEERDDPQGLLLAAGDVLWSTSLEELGCAPLTLLTACSAGRGSLRRGDDGRHRLSGAALVAGARAVLLPRLDVQYAATLDFTEAFGRAVMRAGLAPDEAARRAREQLAARDPDRIDPFLLHVVGLADAPLASPAPRRTERSTALIAGGAVLLLVALAAAWRLRRSGRSR